MNNNQNLVFELKTLTPIWTGGVHGNDSSFRTSGVMGSLRWWYELVVRAMGVYACCTVEEPCPDNDGKHCAVCDLFGCTGWSRKFKLRVEQLDGKVATEQLHKNKTYRFNFIFTRPRRSNPEEIWLLMNLLRNVVAPYGSIGGKMPNKPSDVESKQEKKHHRDYGLFEILSQNSESDYSQSMIEDYLRNFKVKDGSGAYRRNDPDWPRLDWLFSIKGNFAAACFHQLKINSLIGVNPKNASAIGFCLQGKIGEKSKDIFSFKRDRVWGYCKDDSRRVNIVTQIKADLGSSVTEDVAGNDFFDKLFSNGRE